MISRVIGQIASMIVYGIISFMGVGLVTELYPNLVPILAIVGSVYLGYVAISQISLTSSPVDVSAQISAAEDRPKESNLLKGFTEGFFVGLSNPKIMLVYLVVLPQFTSVEYSIPHQMTVLIGSQWIIKSSALIFYVQLSHKLSGLVHQPKTRQNIVNGCSVFLIMIATYIFYTNLNYIYNGG